MEDAPKTVWTPQSAGRKGGQATAERHGPDYYKEIGKKGGQRMKELIAKGKAAEGE